MHKSMQCDLKTQSPMTTPAPAKLCLNADACNAMLLEVSEHCVEMLAVAMPATNEASAALVGSDDQIVSAFEVDVVEEAARRRLLDCGSSPLCLR